MAASCRGDQSDTTSAWKERNGLHHAHVLSEESQAPKTSPTGSSSYAGNDEETGDHQRRGE